MYSKNYSSVYRNIYGSGDCDGSSNSNERSSSYRINSDISNISSNSGNSSNSSSSGTVLVVLLVFLVTVA